MWSLWCSLWTEPGLAKASQGKTPCGHASNIVCGQESRQWGKVDWSRNGKLTKSSTLVWYWCSQVWAHNIEVLLLLSFHYLWCVPESIKFSKLLIPFVFVVYVFYFYLFFKQVIPLTFKHIPSNAVTVFLYLLLNCCCHVLNQYFIIKGLCSW
jgi:hypothetical protein